MNILFWSCIAGIAYVYCGYPAILALAGRFRPAPQPVRNEFTPSLTLIVSAYNERNVIAQKLDNSLALDYPRDRLQVIVVSDCSDDGTDDIVQGYAGEHVTLLRMAERSGKSLGLNAAVAAASGDVLVFTDANALFDRHALRTMARHFADPTVGAVTGAQRYHPSASGSGQSEGLYWRYELLVKRLESSTGSLVGGDGAILAIRRELFEPLEAADLSDFLVPLRIVAAGFRNLFEPDASCYEHFADSFAKEFQRKVRIVNRAWRATMKVRPLLNPLRHGWFAIQLWSHKVLRWLVGLLMAGAMVSNAALLAAGPVYRLTFAGQLAFYALAALGYGRSRSSADMPALLSAPYYLCLVNLASLKGIWDNWRGKTYATWNTARAG